MTVLIAGLLIGGLAAAMTTPALARPQSDRRQAQPTLSLRAVPPVVTVGEPAAATAVITPAREGRTVEIQTKTPDGWVLVGSTSSDAAGRATVELETSAVGSQVLRAKAGSLQSGQVTLQVRDSGACTPNPAPVDGDATAEATCLAARLNH